MGRKRRVEVEKPPTELVAIPPYVASGQAPKEETRVDPVMVEVITKKALAYAVENGLQGKIAVSEPRRVEYPRVGYGYHVMVREEDGKGRMASAHFTSEGLPAMWTMDTKGAVI